MPRRPMFLAFKIIIMKKITAILAILVLGTTPWTGCSSEEDTTGSDYVPPADQSPEEEGEIDGADE